MMEAPSFSVPSSTSQMDQEITTTPAVYPKKFLDNPTNYFARQTAESSSEVNFQGVIIKKKPKYVADSFRGFEPFEQYPERQWEEERNQARVDKLIALGIPNEFREELIQLIGLIGQERPSLGDHQDWAYPATFRAYILKGKAMIKLSLDVFKGAKEITLLFDNIIPPLDVISSFKELHKSFNLIGEEKIITTSPKTTKFNLNTEVIFHTESCAKEALFLPELNRTENDHVVDVYHLFYQRRFKPESNIHGYELTIGMKPYDNDLFKVVSDSYDRRDAIRSGRRIEWNQRNHEEVLKNYAIQIFDSLRFLHEKGIIHQDVKPENFLLDVSSQRICITDFGLAARIGEKPIVLPSSQTWDYQMITRVNLKDLKFIVQPSLDIWGAACAVWQLFTLKNPPWRIYVKNDQLTEAIRCIDRTIDKLYNVKDPGNEKELHPLAFIFLNLFTKKLEKRWTAVQALEHLRSWDVGAVSIDSFTQSIYRL